MADRAADAGASSTSSGLNAHEMRITSHGKMNAWVDFALKFFEVLTTLQNAHSSCY